MGYKKPDITTINDLKLAPLPSHGKKYTVISHESIINLTKSILLKNNFKIIKEFYKSTKDAEIAQGIYHIIPVVNHIEDPDLGMMFTWINSYNKIIKFQCGIGAYTYKTENVIISGNINTYSRKHIGDAMIMIKDQIDNQISNAFTYYAKIIAEKNKLIRTEMTFNDEYNLIGQLIMSNTASVSQTYSIKNEIQNPSFHYKNDGSAWVFYNNVLNALKTTHPKSWLKNTLAFHKMIMTQLNITVETNYIEEEESLSQEDLETVFDDMDINGNEYVEVDEEILSHGQIDAHEISDLQDGFNDFYL